jgi:hypothetical protein
MAGQAIPKSPLWITAGRLYRVRSQFYGEFLAMCEEAHPLHAIFRPKEFTPIMRQHGYSEGDVVYMKAEFCAVEVVNGAE